MKNLEQIRAAHALGIVENDRDNRITRAEVNKLPAMIVANGLLAATSFAKETTDEGEAKRPGMRGAMDSVATLLARDVFGIAAMSGATDADDLVARLTEAESPELQRATTEALAYLGYLKRFVKPGKE